MSDYYSVLSRAVANLPQNNADARQELYKRARSIVTEQLRKRELDELSPEMTSEQVALDTAIRRLEVESRSIRRQPAKHPAPPRSEAAGAQAKATAVSLAKILQHVQSDKAPDIGPKTSDRSKRNLSKAALGRAQPGRNSSGNTRKTSPADDLADVPHSVGAMLFGIAYIVAAMAFTGVVYIRCEVWVSEGIISYPILLAAVTAMLSLFIVPPLAISRNASA